MPVLGILDLSYCAQSGRAHFLRARSREILSGISLTLEAGQCLGIVGESGSGKTTLAKCIAGLAVPTSGAINLFGVNVCPETHNRQLVRRKVQYLFQNYTSSLDPLMTIGQSLQEAVDPGGVIPDDGAKERAEDLLRVVQLPPDVISRLPRDLSGGQRQRVAIARALSADPELLILDEPASALDVLTRKQILSLVKEIQQKRSLTLIYISHDVSTTLTLCDRLAVLCQGSIVEAGIIGDILAHPRDPYTKRLLRLSGVTGIKGMF
jgi:peptide/nickel transport system ATP-binding protein